MAAAAESTKIIRDAAFAQRLEQAADLHPHCPPKHRGRLDWVRERMAELGETISNETVRKWFAGEAKPRPDKGTLLAQVMEVDTAWLQMGIDANIAPRERKLRNAMADGAVNVVAGLIQMDGGFPAFPEKEDPVIDLHAIIRGAKYDFHVALGTMKGKRATFPVPAKHDGVIVLGLLRDGFNISVFELSPATIAKGTLRGASIEVTGDPGKLKRVDSFAERL